MAILQLPTPLAAQSGLFPANKLMVTTDDLATVTTAGYLNAINLEAFPLSTTDIIAMFYSFNSTTNVGTYGVFTVAIANGVITLNLWANPGDVLLPVVSGDFAVFNGTTGQIKDAGYSPSNAAKTKVVMANGATTVNYIATYTDTVGTVGQAAPTAINQGNIQAGLSGVSGAFTSYPGTANKGTLSFEATANINNDATILTNASMGQSSTIIIPDPVHATAYLDTSLSALAAVNPKPLVFTITALSSDLAFAGQVHIINSTSVTAQFEVLDLRVLYSASGLSGGGGDRLIVLTDGVTVFNQAGITAELLGTPVYTLWGGSGNPLPGAVTTISDPGSGIYIVYSGGSVDYNAGSITLQITLAQITQ